MFIRFMVLFSAVTLASCGSSKKDEIGGLQCFGIGLFGSEHESTVELSSDELEKQFLQVSSFSQIDKAPGAASSLLVSDLAGELYENGVNGTGCSGIFCATEENKQRADDFFTKEFYIRFVYESLSIIKKDSYKEDCYRFSYDKLYKTGEKTEDGKEISSGFSTEVTVKLDGVEKCDFSTESNPSIRREQTTAFCSSSAGF